jgi:hypothetical protein
MHSFVRFLSRFVLFATALRLLLGSAEARAATPSPDTQTVLFLGIYRGSSDEQASAAPAIETAVAARLKSLGFKLVEAQGVLATSAPPTEFCRKPECLSSRAAQAGTDFALTGSVLRISDLCSADLWLYDRRADKTQRAEIHCQSKTPDSTLADEFADQAGSLSEPAPAPLILPAAPPPRVTHAPPSPWGLDRRQRPYWNRGRVAAASTLAIASAALWTTTITLFVVQCPSGNCVAYLPTDTSNSSPVLYDDIRHGILVSSAVVFSGLALSLTIPERRK